MTDSDTYGDETSDPRRGIAFGIRNALLIELALGLIVWLVWRFAA